MDTPFLLLSGLTFISSSSAQEISCQELQSHLENGKRTESFLMVVKFNRSGTTTITEDDGHLWEMWQNLQRLKKEKEISYAEKNCPENILEQ